MSRGLGICLGLCSRRDLLTVLVFVAFGSLNALAEERQYTIDCFYDSPLDACRVDFAAIETLSEAGDKEARFLLAMRLYENKSSEFKALLVTSADDGYVWAQVVLGSLLALEPNSYSDERKVLLGLRYLESAAKQKSWLAKALTGIAQHLYGNKFGSKKHIVDGIRQTGRAAMLREPVALAWASTFYLTARRRGVGTGQANTFRNLVGLLALTADVGWAAAAYELATVYSTEPRTRSHQLMALRWFRTAHLMGQRDALTRYWRFAANGSVDSETLARVREDVSEWLRKRIEDRSSNFFHAKQWCDDGAAEDALCPFRMAIGHYDCTFIWLSVIPDFIGTQEYSSCMKRHYSKENDGRRTIRTAIESIVPLVDE